MKQYDVHLGAALVGHIAADEEGRSSFTFSAAYRRRTDRPVLGQFFEDDLNRVYQGKRYELPPFFANLVPEGSLRRLLEHSHGIPEGDDLALLDAVGRDLPGAVTVVASEEATFGRAGESLSPPEPSLRQEAGADVIGKEDLRFSLAGVQMKFSVLNEAERITLPGRSELGQWIVKLDSMQFPNLVENEFATLEWAREVGFEVPECHLLPRTVLPEALKPYAPPNSKVLVIERYDREGGKRIHQEDFAQVVGLPPRLKYHHIKYEQLAVLAQAIVGEPAFDEVVKRLVFMIATGNFDAHLKNWSLYYPDSIQPHLAPLYDQVAVAAWPGMVDRTWALKLAGVKDPYQTNVDAFERLAVRAGVDSERTLNVVDQTLRSIAKAWRSAAVSEVMPPWHTEQLEKYWRRVPLLRNSSCSSQR